MLRPEYIPLIQALTESTHNGVLNWVKGNSYQSYVCSPTTDQKLLIDKYYSLAENQTITCVNLTIFKSNDEIIDEIVLCRAVDVVENYDLLENLYKEVEMQYYKEKGKNIPPVLTHITESLQQRNHGLAHP
jgi:hypothetical protein